MTTGQPPAVGAVLVADDEPSLRFLCRVNLEAEGHRVLEAGSGAELAAVLAAEDVTVLLLDIGLGADDGVAIARQLRAERPELSIAFFSGSSAPLDREVRDLAQHVLTKPFSLEELSGTVALLVGR